ncbi:hypothetical protein M0802_005270 [Mischocyttarus mexicanus]|nr:hypothetical protein M0802_005270 [Mischocyttarus mexicanus]
MTGTVTPLIFIFDDFAQATCRCGHEEEFGRLLEIRKKEKKKEKFDLLEDMQTFGCFKVTVTQIRSSNSFQRVNRVWLEASNQAKGPNKQTSKQTSKQASKQASKRTKLEDASETGAPAERKERQRPRFRSGGAAIKLNRGLIAVADGATS